MVGHGVGHEVGYGPAMAYAISIFRPRSRKTVRFSGGTDNVRGQISEHIFAPNEGYCLYI